MTVVVKVHGHSSDPLHTHADILAVQGANKELEEDEQPLFPAPRSDPLSFKWTSRKGGEENQVWGKAVKHQIRRRLGEARWSGRKLGFCEAFLSRPNSASFALDRSRMGRSDTRVVDEIDPTYRPMVLPTADQLIDAQYFIVRGLRT